MRECRRIDRRHSSHARATHNAQTTAMNSSKTACYSPSTVAPRQLRPVKKYESGRPWTEKDLELQTVRNYPMATYDLNQVELNSALSQNFDVSVKNFVLDYLFNTHANGDNNNGNN